MILPGNIELLYPWMLLLLPLVIGLGVVQYKRYRQQQSAMLLSTYAPAVKHRSLRTRLKPLMPFLRYFILFLLVLAMTRPRRLNIIEKVNARVVDIALVMDISSSMLAMDLEPNRLEASKEVAKRFIDRRKYDRIGLVAFAGEAFTQCPVTPDHSILKQFMDGLQVGILEDGTAIGTGLATAVNRLEKSEVKHKIIILLTDGVNNAGYAQPMTAAGLAQEFGIKVYTIGVGTQGTAKTPMQRGYNGQYLYGFAKVEIDEALLKEIAQLTGGRYFRAVDRESLERIYDEIDQLEPSEVEITSIKRYEEVFYFLMLPALLLLVLDMLLNFSYLRAFNE